MRIQLSDHFTYRRLLRFVASSVIMMVFTSIYTVIDGLFVSNYVGKTPFAALNLIWPLIMALGAVGFMLGTGGSAIVAKTLGEKKPEKANEYFSMIIFTTILAGIGLAVLGLFVVRPVAILLGATSDMMPHCVLYGSITLIALPAFMLQNVFQSFLVTAERPKTGLFIMILAGVTNICLDAFFIIGLDWGIAGAAAATSCGQLVGGIIPFFCFINKKTRSRLHLTRPHFNGRILLKACTNGSSELMTNLSASIVTTLYNFQLIRLAGENGVAAYGVISYVFFIFSGIFFGYSIASAPIISFHYGARNDQELKNLFKKSLTFLITTGMVLMTLAILSAPALANLFVGYDAELCEMTTHGLGVYGISYLICGINIFASAFFTALNNGAVSAAISFLRTFVFQIAVLILLPIYLNLDGIWLAVTVAELLSLFVSTFFFIIKKKQYHYA